MAAGSFSRLSGMMCGDAPAAIPRSTFSVVAGLSELATPKFVLMHSSQEEGRRILTNVIRSMGHGHPQHGGLEGQKRCTSPTQTVIKY